MKQTYKTGDIVQLKSGGPKMAVNRYVESDIIDDAVDGPKDGPHVVCQWFAGAKLERGTFPEQSLQPVEPDKRAQL